MKFPTSFTQCMGAAICILGISPYSMADTLPERLIIQLKPQTPLRQLNTSNTINLPPSSTKLADGTYSIDGGTDITALEQQLKQNPNVLSVERDTPIYPMGIYVTPNDLRYSEQLHLHSSNPTNLSALNLPSAWPITKGSEQITIGVLDTGITDHPDLATNLVGHTAAHSGYDMIKDTKVGNDGNARDIDPRDTGDSAAQSSWHGTHIAGSIAAQGNNGQGITGVSWYSKLLNVRILGRNGGYTSDLIDGIYWALGKPVNNLPINTNPAHIINLSLGGKGTCSTSLQNAINTATAQGVPVVVAAGNASINARHYTPANCQNVIVVAALDRYGHAASISNYGEIVDIASAGVGILSTSNTGSSMPDQATYRSMSGTSMATAQVSGVLALMLSANPELKYQTNLTQRLEQKLKASSRAFTNTSGAICGSGGCGAGILDAYRAVQAVTTPPTPVIKIKHYGDTTYLDASSSYDDIANNKLTYHWEQISGETLALSSNFEDTIQIAIPDRKQSYAFKLTISDDLGLNSSKVIDITPSNTAMEAQPPSTPTANNTPEPATTSSSGGGSIPFWIIVLLGLTLLRRHLK